MFRHSALEWSDQAERLTGIAIVIASTVLGVITPFLI